MDVIGESLRIGGTATAQTENVIAQVRDFIRATRRDVTAHTGARIGSQDNAALKGNGDNGGAGRFFIVFEAVGIVGVGIDNARAGAVRGDNGLATGLHRGHHGEAVYLSLVCVR